jgi:hypothetical protein
VSAANTGVEVKRWGARARLRAPQRVFGTVRPADRPPTRCGYENRAPHKGSPQEPAYARAPASAMERAESPGPEPLAVKRRLCEPTPSADVNEPFGSK